MEPLSPELMEDLRHGRATRERKLAVCAGGAHLAPADRAELLAVLAGDADEMVSERAQDAILSQPIESFVEAIRREHVLPALLSYASKHLADKPGVCDAMVQNKNCPAEYLVPVVRHLSTIGIQSLMEELDRVSESPALAAALEHSTSVTVEQKIDRFCEGHKGSDPDVIGIAGRVDQAGGAGSVSALQNRGRAGLGVRMQLECLAAGKSCQAGHHE